MAFEYFDTHAHLPMLSHSPEPEILARANEAGVTRMVTVATEEGNWATSRECAERHENVYYSIGVHPHEAMHWNDCGPRMLALFDKGIPKKCVAVGELGLDFHYDLSPRDKQLEALEAQLRLAKDHDLPVIVHCRDAFADLFEVIDKVGGLGKGKGVMHCFTGATPDANAAVTLGMMISFSGIVTFKNAENLRETAKGLPVDAIVIETDCPYLAPIPFRGKPNEPSFLPLTAQTIATARGVSVEEVAQATTRNAMRLFGIGA